MIKLIFVGKLKEKYLVDATGDYTNRIKKYHKLEIIEIPDTNIQDEEEKILSKIKNEYVILLDIKGEILDSVGFSKKLNNLFTNGKSDITFIIGSSEGVSEKVKQRSDYLLSFSKLTFPHALFRLMFLEQLYRCFKIINNETYHK